MSRGFKSNKILICATFIVIVITIIISIIPKKYVVNGLSMYPTLEDGQIVLVKNGLDDYKHGDIVILNKPNTRMTNLNVEAQFGDYAYSEMVKRIVAIEGDIIEFDNGIVKVNEVVLQDYEDTFKLNFSKKLQPNEFFVLGDNSTDSYDSRFFGVVKRSDIKYLVLNK